MKHFYPALATLSIFLLISCNPFNKKTDDGPTETVVYKLEAYDQIINNSVVNIEITDEVPKDEIHISGSKKSLETFTRKVTNNTLVLDDSEKKQILNGQRMVAKINHNHLKSIILEGVGSIEGKLTQSGPSIQIKLNGTGNINLNVNNDKTDVTIEGVGNVNLKGKTIALQTNINGTGNLNAEMLESKTSINNIEGIGNAHIWSTEKIDATIGGIGNLYYKSSPNLIITSSVDGLGRVKERN